MGVFEEMRSLLQGPPSARRWSRLCAYAATSESARFVDGLLPYALHHLDRSWPDELRVADRAWLAAVLEDAPAPWMAMARSIQAGILDDERSWQWTFDEGRELDAFVAPLGEERWTRLFEEGFLSSATDLFMNEQGLGQGGARALVASDLATQLRSLRVHDEGDVVRELLLGLARRDMTLELEVLGLSGAVMDDEFSRELDAFAERSRLRTVQLRSANSSMEGEDLHWPVLVRQLEGLDLYESHMPEMLPAICALPFQRLRSLNLGDADAPKELVDVLIASTWLDGIEELDLSWSSNWEEEEFDALFVERGMPALSRLDLTAGSIGTDALSKILRGDALPRLKFLELGIADVVTSSLFEKFDAPIRSDLEFLGLGTCSMSGGLIDIIEKGHWARLRHIDIPNNDPDEDEILYIFGAAEALKRLERLGLGENELDDDALVHAASALALPELVHLDLRNNNLTDEGAKRLARCAPLAQLEVLDVRYNRLSEEGVEALRASEVLAECAIVS